jgi:hypothetical protein
MKQGYQLTIEQGEQLEGRVYADDEFFNPYPDINGNLFVFQAEVDNCTDFTGIEWLQNITLSDYVPPLDPTP